MDRVTLERIDQIHPRLRADLKNDYEFINSQLPKNVRLRFTFTYRSIDEQNDLYAQGRTKPGKIVTNAKGGQSMHNYGLAFDIVLLFDYDNNESFETANWDLNEIFMKVVNYFKAKGWEWGGDWKRFKDYPHFQMTFGNDLKKLKAMPTIINNGLKYPKL
ncbi:peptidase M15B and M15C DD-carboxypeptidase VanY/endolysin [Flavobacterium columnare ATCC 49512]|uniref:Peptidase M15B and M15C DD-carboxypeptidase VanY/endolysin n=1 Tax=Flavobacterium columnare (strain ATCC 49512 / CIP 103533 / TG 44/87) TaxID=1041826 RepID=G8X9E5_FLACA|nr:M15 family metallopeptidase [Flavobacterium columnare]AEW85892.1 peptidase M15B and M15C DD-carboxypeptidase VanY/endolysin [Flavobacterium columnare ATCC 49512]